MKVYIQKTATEETKARILLQNMQEIKSEEFSLWINTAFVANLLDFFRRPRFLKPLHSGNCLYFHHQVTG